MSKDEAGPPGEDGSAFEASLADVVSRAFARGVDVERTWRIDPPVADAPGWQIAITRMATENGYDPSLIEDRRAGGRPTLLRRERSRSVPRPSSGDTYHERPV